jgi:hypothetical protein
MATIRATEALRRYTDLPALLHMLKHKKITLVDPASWDDTNDSYYLLKYKDKKSLKSVLALCLTQADETYHHWRVFSHGSAGVCIAFHRERLLKSLLAKDGVVVKDVKYRKVREARKQIRPPKISELPFLKRAAFEPEEEVRAIFESKRKKSTFLDVPLDLSSVLRVTLSPWIPYRLKGAVKDAIHSIPGCEHLDVRRSTLVGNAEWKKLGDKAT